MLAYHIREGAYGNVRLDGLNVLAVAQFDGNIWTGEAHPSLGLYIDARADERQRDALQGSFRGWRLHGQLCRHGRGSPGLEFVPIFEVADDLAYWRAEIPGKVVAAAEALSGPTTPPGARVQLLNPPGSEVGPGQVATWGKATANEVDAYGFQWNWASKSSKHIPFDWTGPS